MPGSKLGSRLDRTPAGSIPGGGGAYRCRRTEEKGNGNMTRSSIVGFALCCGLGGVLLPAFSAHADVIHDSLWQRGPLLTSRRGYLRRRLHRPRKTLRVMRRQRLRTESRREGETRSPRRRNPLSYRRRAGKVDRGQRLRQGQGQGVRVDLRTAHGVAGRVRRVDPHERSLNEADPQRFRSASHPAAQADRIALLAACIRRGRQRHELAALFQRTETHGGSPGTRDGPLSRRRQAPATVAGDRRRSAASASRCRIARS